MATAQDYRDALKKLAPRGAVWPTDNNTGWVKLLGAFSEEFARIDAKALQLLQDVFPDTTVELLDEWERIAGIPDLCTQRRSTLSERRADVIARLTSRGGQTKQYFIELAAKLGYAISITEYDAFRVGENAVGEPLLDEDWEFVWEVHTKYPPVTVHYFEVGASSVGESLGTWDSDNRLECLINARKPAHTVVFFIYS